MGNISDKIAAVLSAVAVIFLGSVIYFGATATENPMATDYVLDIKAAVGDGFVRVEGETNLPDDARLDIVIDRLFRLQGRGVWSAARVGEAQVAVQDGEWRKDIPIDDTSWADELVDRVDRREIDAIEAILPDMRVTVLFSPLIEQPEKVKNLMGTNFEQLTNSKLAVEEGDYWVLRRQYDFNHPLDQQQQARLMGQP